jgi:FkbM family methyltransferase
MPLCQAILQRLPLIRISATRALGSMLGHSVKAVVNQATMKLDLCETIQQQMFLGHYEPTQTNWFKQFLHNGDIFIDVGASFGYYSTLAASLVGPTGKVFAFEPSPVANQVLERTINDSNLSNIVLTRAAVGRKTGSATLFLPTTRNLHSPSVLESDPGFIPIQVPLIDLDHFAPLQNIPKIKLVKIDVEGYEPDVLAGMEMLIKEQRIENLICEFNSWWLRKNGMTPLQLHERILDLGFQVLMKTKLETNIIGHNGELFDLQDIFFSMRRN